MPASPHLEIKVAVKKAEIETGLQIDALKQGRVTLRMIGQTPFYFNAMSVKAKRSLLLGGGKKTASEKKELKHDPEQEFRDSVTGSQPATRCFASLRPASRAQWRRRRLKRQASQRRQ